MTTHLNFPIILMHIKDFKNKGAGGGASPMLFLVCV